MKKPYPREITVGNASVKVYRLKHPRTAGGWLYRLTWYAGPIRKESSFADEATALKEARIKAGQLSDGRTEGASMTTGDRDELQAARAITDPTPLLSALAEWAKARTVTENHVLPACEFWAARNISKHERKTASEVVTLFLAAKTRAGIATVKNHGHVFQEIKKAFGDSTIDSIGAAQLSAWLESWDNPSTRNTCRKHMVGLWRWAQKQGYLPRELKTEAEQTDRAKEGPLEIGIISKDTLEALLGHFQKKHPEYIPALVLAALCGLRRSEVHGQKWANIQLERKHVRVTAAKKNTPASRIVPLCDSAVEWLKLTEDRTEFVCPNIAIDRIRDIGKTAGFILHQNCLRHGYITHRVAQTGNVAETALESGNSPGVIFKHYRELVSKEEGSAFFQIWPQSAR